MKITLEQGQGTLDFTLDTHGDMLPENIMAQEKQDG